MSADRFALSIRELRGAARELRMIGVDLDRAIVQVDGFTIPAGVRDELDAAWEHVATAREILADHLAREPAVVA